MPKVRKYNIHQLRGAFSAGFNRGAKEDHREYIFSIGETTFTNPVGKFFHSFEDGRFSWQGQVIKRVDANTYQVQLYEWIFGYPSDVVTCHAQEMRDWNFYYTDKEMRYFYEQKTGLKT